MKIKIQANGNTDLSSILSHLDLSQGYSYHGSDLNNKESLSSKLLKKIDNSFSRNNSDENISIAVAKSLADFTTTIEQGFLAKTTVQLNITSLTHKAFKKLGSIVSEKNLNTMLDIPTSYANLNENKVVLGLDILDNKQYSFIQSMISKYKNEEVMKFVLFHELGHLLHHNHANNDISSLCLEYEKLDYFNTTKATLFNKEYLSIENENFSPLDHMIMMPIKQVRGEMYADVAAILIKRNIDIYNGVFDINTLIEDIENINNSRLAYVNYATEKMGQKWNASTELRFTNHVTCAALEDLVATMNSLGSAILSEEKIAEISNTQMHKGMAKYIYSVTRINEQYKNQFNTLFASYFNHEDKVEFNINNALENSQKVWNNINNLAGKDWIAQFEDKLKQIRNNPLSSENNDLAVFSAGMNIKSNNVIPEKINENLVRIAGVVEPKINLQVKIAQIRNKEYPTIVVKESNDKQYG